MTSTRALAILALVAPLTAAAQVSYSQATIIGERPYYSGTLRVCNERNASLWDRKALLDEDQQVLDREGARLDRMKARLDAEYARLNWNDNVAINAYNDRSANYNRLVEEHNQRTAQMNGAAARLNGDSSELARYCDGIVVLR